MTATVTDRELHIDAQAETAVVACCLNAPTGTADMRRHVDVSMFADETMGKFYALALELDDASKPVDPAALYALLADRRMLGRDGTVANRLHETYGYPYLSAGYSARRVAALWRTRERLKVAKRMAQTADQVTDPDDAADQLAKLSVEMELLIEEADGDGPVRGLETWDSFMAKPRTSQDWVIPGLLAKQEAVLVLAGPGLGKSWLSRQIVTTAAGGVHPFKPETRIKPVRTLLIDLENAESTVRDQVSATVVAVHQISDRDYLGDQGWVWMYPAGLNIRKRMDAALLERVIQQTRPELVCIGSLYNIFQRGADDHDTAAEEVITVFNRLRDRYGVALWIEHHMPKGGDRARPFGSSMWERWPSFGRVIKPIDKVVFDFVADFREDRAAGRDFPPGLKKGGGRLPWTSIWDAGDLGAMRDSIEADRKSKSRWD